MTNPDFILLARAMGVHAIRCTRAEDLPAKMKEFLEYDGQKPVLMECVVESHEHVFPMVHVSHLLEIAYTDDFDDQVPAGRALDEQLMHPSLAAAIKPKA
jgi:acetolactate synthase I/II/III large subunit